MKGLIAEIALQGAAFSFDKLYTYAVPEKFWSQAKPGCRAQVPFGKGNINRQGMIFGVCEADVTGLKQLVSLTDPQPVLSDELLKLCVYMQETVFCTYYDAVSSMLPAGLGMKTVNYYSYNEEFAGSSLLDSCQQAVCGYLQKNGETEETKLKSRFSVTTDFLEDLVRKEALVKSSGFRRKMEDATQKWVRLSGFECNSARLTQRQQEVVSLLSDIGSAAVKEICYFTGVSASVVEALIKKEVLVSFEKKVFRNPAADVSKIDDSEINLTPEQQAAYEGMMSDYSDTEAKTSLLYGVTGSGKTQVFLKLADRVMQDNRGVIVMVPEISLTPQLISVFTSRYGSTVAVFHSAMSMGRRLDEWKKVKEGKALIAIGTRSAVFAPFSDLGLIIIDEEQEHTYKSEKSPRFHARDIARFRTGYHKGLLCLSSATPSVETYTMAKKGIYSIYRLENRYGNSVLPEVETVDMKAELQNGNTAVLSGRLYEAINDVLQQKKQVILLLNRRGHNTYVSCSCCGYVETCPHCSVSLTYHSANKRLMCHYCGYSKKVDDSCPECGNKNMKFTGLGTQKAEEELHALFPKANVLRLDADSTAARDSYTAYLNDFAEGKYDILIGTQMVAKGLNFPNVTLVGVLGADSAMYSEDFRSFERSFSLLAQVVGRAGRGECPGRAIIQTADPGSNLIELAKNQDYDSFYNEEILNRRLMVYPPYCDICLVSASSAVKEKAEQVLNKVFENIKNLLDGEFKGVKLIILGPSSAAVSKVNNRYRFRMIIKCRNNTEFRKMLRSAVNVKLTGDSAVSVDINPENVI